MWSVSEGNRRQQNSINESYKYKPAVWKEKHFYNNLSQDNVINDEDKNLSAVSVNLISVELMGQKIKQVEIDQNVK